jgi:hypothetical protein
MNLCLQPTELPNNETDLMVRVDALMEPPKSRMCYKLPGPSYCKAFLSEDKLQTLNTAITRYSKTTKQVERPEDLGQRMYECMINTAFRRPPKITMRHIQIACAELELAMQEKGTEKDVKDLIEDSKELHVVDFFMKRITKFKVSTMGPNASDKAGQGIASHDKTMNAFWGVMVRATEQAIKEALKPNFIWANGDPEELYGHNFIAQADVTAQNLEGDGVEFDASQNRVTHHLEKTTFINAGVPKEVVDFCFSHKEFRRFMCKTVFTLDVEQKKDSGYADTLFGNSLWTLGCLCWVIVFTFLNLVLIKGDDNGVNGTGLKIDPVRLKELEDIGCRWKFKFTNVLSFCNFFYTNAGALPDVLQRMTKLISRKFYTTDEVRAYHVSMIDQIRFLNTNRKLEVCRKVLAHYYEISEVESSIVIDNFFTLVNEGAEKLLARMNHAEYYIGRTERCDNHSPELRQVFCSLRHNCAACAAAHY